ncbi:MAG: HAMP domain-containing protein [Phycisphaerales bacterium]|nr:HAMP domain-containing protein [Phycisphaerales bacterium]
MLRQKLLARIGFLVLGFVGGAIISIALLEMLLRDAERASEQTASLTALVDTLGEANAALVSPGVGASVGEGDLQSAQARFDRAWAALMDAHWLPSDDRSALDEIGQTLRGAPDRHALDTHVVLAPMIAGLHQALRSEASRARQVFSKRLRWLIIGLTGGALLMLNVSVIVLLHTGGMILRPVSALVEGSRLLAREEFDHRVEVKGPQEFGELAHAYNELASRLQMNEQRKKEVLQQLGVSLNHELNNVLGIIELQLRLLDRRTGSDHDFAEHLRQIRANLGRMADTVASLKNVRRIVVTEYPGGRKMLDLPRCTTERDEEVVVVKATAPKSAEHA